MPLCPPLLALAGTSLRGGAQQTDTLRKTLRATTRTGPIHVDGRLSEPDWARAEVATGFVQRKPEPNEPESQRTEVRVLVNDGALYVAARMFDAVFGDIEQHELSISSSK